jgi:hypothetical protein
LWVIILPKANTNEKQVGKNFAAAGNNCNRIDLIFFSLFIDTDIQSMTTIHNQPNSTPKTSSQ